jgi:hypothetical protein
MGIAEQILVSLRLKKVAERVCVVYWYSIQ